MRPWILIVVMSVWMLLQVEHKCLAETDAEFCERLLVKQGRALKSKDYDAFMSVYPPNCKFTVEHASLSAADWLYRVKHEIGSDEVGLQYPVKPV